VAPQVFSSFSLTGDERFDPDDFTAATGLTPTTCWRKGDVSRGRARQHSFWCLTVGPDLTPEHEEQVLHLLDVMEPQAEVIARLIEQNDVDAQFGLWSRDAGTDESTPDVQLSSSVLNRVTALGASLDIDM